MKTTFPTLLVAGFAGVIIATTPVAAQNNVISFDEFGNGTFGTNTLASGTATDPFSGINTLVYFLPFQGGFGDLLVGEGPGAISDVLRFDGNGHLFVFSDNTDSDPSTPPADVGLPATFLAVVRFAPETGPEAGPNGVFGYTPSPGDPGADSVGPVYNFLSDPTPAPEPGTLALVASGLVFAGLRFWRRP